MRLWPVTAPRHTDQKGQSASVASQLLEHHGTERLRRIYDVR